MDLISLVPRRLYDMSATGQLICLLNFPDGNAPIFLHILPYSSSTGSGVHSGFCDEERSSAKQPQGQLRNGFKSCMRLQSRLIERERERERDREREKERERPRE